MSQRSNRQTNEQKLKNLRRKKFYSIDPSFTLFFKLFFFVCVSSRPIPSYQKIFQSRIQQMRGSNRGPYAPMEARLPLLYMTTLIISLIKMFKGKKSHFYLFFPEKCINHPLKKLALKMFCSNQNLHSKDLEHSLGPTNVTGI